jgi:hypothetical protein
LGKADFRIKKVGRAHELLVGQSLGCRRNSIAAWHFAAVSAEWFESAQQSKLCIQNVRFLSPFPLSARYG